MNDNEEQIVLTTDQQEAYDRLSEKYPGATVNAIEGSDKVVVRYTNKVTKTNGDTNNIDVEVYLPSNISDATQSYTFYNPGGNEDKAKRIPENAALDTLNDDSILCITSADDINTGLEAVTTIDGTLIDNHTSIGWSRGGKTAYFSTIDKIKENPNIKPQTIVFLELLYNGDDLGRDDYKELGFEHLELSDQNDIEYLKSNGSVVIAFESTTIGDASYDKGKYYKAFGEAGIPIVIVEMNGGHDDIPADAFAEDLLGFLNGGNNVSSLYLDYYTFNEKGEFVKLEPAEALKIMRQNLVFSYSLEDVAHMINEYNKQINLYSSRINDRLSSIKSIMNEFLSTDAGFIANYINKIVSICENVEIKNMIVANNYSSTTTSPKIQDIKMLEYKANVLSLIEDTLSYLNLAMIDQIEIEKTERDIGNEAASLSNNSKDILISTYIGLEAAAADAKGLTGNEKEEYVDKNMQGVYKAAFYDEATKEAESNGLDGEEKDKYIENYINDKAEEIKKSTNNYTSEVETTIENNS